MPVPAELGLKCTKCGMDLTGLDRGICPKCQTRYRLPIPEELDLHCRECDYNLTSLTTRTCPECGTGFDVSGLLFARGFNKGYPLSDLIPWRNMVKGSIGIVLAIFGAALCLRVNLQFMTASVLIAAVVVGKYYAAGVDLHRAMIFAGSMLAVVGLVVWALS